MENEMTDIQMTQKLNHDQVVDFIVANPHIRAYIVGEPGIGKSYLIKEIGRRTGLPTAYIDMPNLDLGDVAMPVIDHESRVTRYYPNARFGLHHGKPVAMMLDEWTKAMTPVKNMTHPMFEVDNPRLGDLPIPEGSYIFLTGNLETDGVGDSMQAHTKQRVTRIELMKPTAEYWIENYAVPNNLCPIVIAWVNQHPHCLASYTDDGQADNELLSKPTVSANAVCSPRTLEKVAGIVGNRGKYDEETLLAAMQGTVGNSAAESMGSYIRHQDDLPSFRSITDNPETARIPTDEGAVAVLCFGLLEKVDANNLTAILKYFERIDLEWQCIFCINLARHKVKSQFAFSNKAFAAWCAANQDVL
jgi:hypothetical protein